MLMAEKFLQLKTNHYHIWHWHMNILSFPCHCFGAGERVYLSLHSDTFCTVLGGANFCTYMAIIKTGWYPAFGMASNCPIAKMDIPSVSEV